MTAQATTSGPSGNPLFLCGQVFTTPGAADALAEAHGNRWRIAAGYLVARHRCGDWGEVCKEDREANNQALLSGARIISCYHMPVRTPVGRPERLWIITEADRSSTTILLPEEY